MALQQPEWSSGQHAEINDGAVRRGKMAARPGTIKKKRTIQRNKLTQRQ
jgi:hypothetical protein